MMTPATVSRFYLLWFVALFVGEIASHLPVRLSDRLVNAPGRVSPNLSELGCCFVDDRRNFGELVWRQVEFGAKSFLHARADQFKMRKLKEMMAGIQSADEGAGAS